MTRMVYVLGGAACGKSTFTGQLLDRIGAELGPQEVLHTRANGAGLDVMLKGQPFEDGVYLGLMREFHPGSDGLDRVAGWPGQIWIQLPGLPGRIVGEGTTLSTWPFLSAAAEAVDLMVVRLWDEEWITELRANLRGSVKNPTYLQSTASRAANLAARLAKTGARVVEAQTSDPDQWVTALGQAANHLS